MWPQGGRAVAWTPPRIPDISRWLARRVVPWLAAEVAPGRLMPWQPSSVENAATSGQLALQILANH
jgi:hypothetical protein